MTATLMPLPKQHYSAASGVPLGGGKIYTYAAGTSTPKATFSDPAGTIPQTNPIVLNVRGEPANAIYWSGSYRVDVRDSLGNLVYTVDNYNTDPAGIWSIFSTLAASAGASLIGFIQAGAGAVLRTLQSKMRELLSITDYSTIVADGTDQTAAIVAHLTALGSGYEGLYWIPYGVKFDFNAVCAALPPGAILRDESAVNGWRTAGYQQNVIGFVDQGKADASVDMQVVISSGHNATLVMDNRGTAGSTSADIGVAGRYWTRGRLSKQTGQNGIRDIARDEYSKIPGENKWWWVLRRAVPWVARNWEYWYTTKNYTSGDYVRSQYGVYLATTSGTAGATEPNWARGVTASDGGVSWICINQTVDSGIFSVNENGEVATNSAPVAGVVAYWKASTESTGDASEIIEATGVSKVADFRMHPTDAAGAVITAIPRWTAQDGVGLRVISSTGSYSMLTMTDAGGLKLGVHSPREQLATNNSSTPSVADCALLRLANSGATNITSLSDSLPTQIVQLWAENGNTTLVHNGGGFLLKGGVNVTLTQNQTLTMQKYSQSGAWFEVSRNF